MFRSIVATAQGVFITPQGTMYDSYLCQESFETKSVMVDVVDIRTLRI